MVGCSPPTTCIPPTPVMYRDRPSPRPCDLNYFCRLVHRQKSLEPGPPPARHLPAIRTWGGCFRQPVPCRQFAPGADGPVGSPRCQPSPHTTLHARPPTPPHDPRDHSKTPQNTAPPLSTCLHTAPYIVHDSCNRSRASRKIGVWALINRSVVKGVEVKSGT